MGFIFLPVILIILLISVVIGRYVWRKALAPLAVPPGLQALETRERRLITFAICAQVLSVFGWVMMAVVYATGIYQHWRAVNAGGAATADRIVPTFRLMDLLAMIFSLGCFPLLLQPFAGTGAQDRQIAQFISAGLMFPAAFVCMLYRLNCNGVPPGARRYALIFLSPYAMLACTYSSVLLLAVIVLAFAARGGMEVLIFAFAAMGVLFLALVHFVARRAKAEARAQAEAVAAETLEPAGPPV